MKAKILLTLVITLALFLRIFAIARFPPTLYGDEQAFAWNAYNILKTGEDEYGNRLPLQFRSFNDYKAPIPVYLLVPFIKFLGLTPLAIRLPIIISSVLTVLIVYLLARLFLRIKVSLLVSFLMAISPWHVHLSRGYFEATLALFFFVLGVFYFLKSRLQLKFLAASMFFFSLSTYSYFTPRILVPIFLLFLVLYNIVSTSPSTSGESYGHPRGGLTTYLLSFLFLIILSIPLVKLTLFDKGFSRFNKLFESRNLIIKNTVNRERYASGLPQFWRVVFHNKAIVLFRLIKNDYLEHLSPNFWYIFGDNSLRYFTGNMGMFYLLEFPFLIIGLYSLWKEKRKVAVFFLGWILIAPIPASLVGRSFAVRSLAMLPAPFVFVGYGIYKSSLFFHRSPGRNRQAPPSRWPDFVGRSLDSVGRRPNGFILKIHPEGLLEGVYWKFPLLLTLGYIFSLSSLLIRYYLEYPVYAATWWGWENKKALDYAREREPLYDYIFISDFYTGSTLAFAVYTQYDPLEYRHAVNNPITMADGRHLIKLGKYYFGSLDIDEERLEKGIIPPKSLYIARPEEADSDETINAPDDGRIIFKIYKTK